MNESLTERKKRGRPRGQQHDVTVHVRMPRPAADASRTLARRCGVSVSTLVRLLVDGALAKAMEPTVKVARNKNASAWQRIKAIKALRMYARAALYLRPVGLTIARAQAAESPHD
ncbi:MAG: hypothetical protein V3T70_03435 [Phycisphaerae bacterium]